MTDIAVTQLATVKLKVAAYDEIISYAVFG